MGQYLIRRQRVVTGAEAREDGRSRGKEERTPVAGDRVTRVAL